MRGERSKGRIPGAACVCMCMNALSSARSCSFLLQCPARLRASHQRLIVSVSFMASLLLMIDCRCRQLHPIRVAVGLGMSTKSPLRAVIYGQASSHFRKPYSTPTEERYSNAGTAGLLRKRKRARWQSVRESSETACVRIVRFRSPCGFCLIFRHYKPSEIHRVGERARGFVLLLACLQFCLVNGLARAVSF